MPLAGIDCCHKPTSFQAPYSLNRHPSLQSSLTSHQDLASLDPWPSIEHKISQHRKRLGKDTSGAGRHKWDRTNRIPSRCGHESISVAARVTTKYNVLDARDSVRVQQIIEEAKCWPLVENTEVINQRDYARYYLYVGGQPGA